MNLVEFNEIATRIAARPIYRAVVLSAHGMRSRGEWQKHINVPLTDAGFLHEPLDFGHIGIVRVPLPGTATAAADVFRDAYYRLSERTPRVLAIAHSFGTIALGKALQINPALRLNRIILWGCVLPRAFPWREFTAHGRVESVLNEACRRDPLPLLACVGCAMHNGGLSGALGFEVGNGVPVVNRFHSWTNHSRLGTALHCRDSWVPFLHEGSIP